MEEEGEEVDNWIGVEEKETNLKGRGGGEEGPS